jgi:hypothetical protein
MHVCIGLTCEVVRLYAVYAAQVESDAGVSALQHAERKLGREHKLCDLYRRHARRQQLERELVRRFRWHPYLAGWLATSSPDS